MKVLLTGGTGFIGSRLCALLAGGGHELRVLTRRTGGGGLPSAAELRPTPAIGDASGWIEAVSGCDAIVNLAGESIAGGRWTDARKFAIHASRIETTRALVDACRELRGGPGVLVSGSAVGYYGACGDAELNETSPPGHDFLSRICVDWETEALKAERLGMRVVRARFGVVLGPGGGALARMVTPFKLFAGGPIGDGEQWLSWVHLDDAVGLLAHGLVLGTLRGPVNVTAPDPRKMRDFCRVLGEVLGRPSWLPVPAFALRALLGEMADMLLTGQRVLPAAAQASGYPFKYPTLPGALRAALSST